MEIGNRRCALLVGMGNAAVTPENSMFPQKVKNKLPYESAVLLPGIQRVMKSRDTRVHNSSFHSIQNVEATHASTSG
jgi:hypothetical protein